MVITCLPIQKLHDTVKLFLGSFEKPLLEVITIRWLLKALENSGLLGLIGFRSRVRAVLLYGWPKL